ncbi:MAG: OsmC family peroxiredoxin [Chitinophagaceae bacterium BSSC1]|nr:MAG: OsmC family peroxiredoxin [Chitinophagaceae bacterium BSSC1]
MKRNATAIWNGSGKEGTGHLSTQSTVLNQTQYSFNSRFAEGVGTNPEELMAAAHAGCFAMKLSFVLGAAGFTPDQLEVNCAISLEDGVITASHLVLTAKISGISEAQFQAAASEAKANCPVSKAYNMTISLDAKLIA